MYKAYVQYIAVDSSLFTSQCTIILKKLYMYMHMYVCMCACMYVYVYIRMCVSFPHILVENNSMLVVHSVILCACAVYMHVYMYIWVMQIRFVVFTPWRVVVNRQ